MMTKNKTLEKHIGLIHQRKDEADFKRATNPYPDLEHNYSREDGEKHLRDLISKLREYEKNKPQDAKIADIKKLAKEAVDYAEKLGRPGLALRIQEQIVLKYNDDDPNSSRTIRAYETAGELAEAGGHKNKADKYFRKAIKLAENNVNWNAYVFAADHGYFGDAAEMCRKKAEDIRSGKHVNLAGTVSPARKSDAIRFDEYAEKYHHMDLEKRMDQYQKRKNIESHATLAISIGLIGTSLFFLSSGITGNVTGSVKSSGSWFAFLFFVLGIAGVALYFRKSR
jgi:hypothetical protein